MKLAAFSIKDIRNPLAGGGTRLFHNILKALAENGHQITLISSRFNGSSKSEVIDGVEVIRLAHQYQLFLRAPMRLMFDNKYEAILECVHVVPLMIPLYVKKKVLLFVFHLAKQEFDVESYRFGILGPFLSCAAKRAENMIPRIYANAQIITFSSPTRDELLSLGVNPANIHLVQEGIDLKKYTPGAMKEDTPTLVYVGRLERYKGVQYILYALKKIRTYMPSIHLKIVGDGTFRQSLENLTSDLGLQSSVSFLGTVSEEEKIRILRSSHLLIHPSLREGWATPVIEANACGTVAIGFSVPGIKETIRDGLTGFLVAYGDVENLVKRILELLQNSELYKEMQTNAISWSRKFSKDEMMLDLRNILSTLLTE